MDDTLYKHLEGNLIYLTSTRPNLVFVANLLSWYMAHTTTLHLHVAKCVLRNVKSTLVFVVFYCQEVNH